jgi:hypothetical protein
MRQRRKKYVPAYEVWAGDMQLYRRDVVLFVAHRQDCRSRGEMIQMQVPEYPTRPSHLPSEEELAEMIKHYHATKNHDRKCKLKEKGKLTCILAATEQLGHAAAQLGRVGRLAMAAGIDDAKKKIGEDDFQAAPTSGGELLIDEVAGILAPTASHPAPAGAASVDRPVQPSPV